MVVYVARCPSISKRLLLQFWARRSRESHGSSDSLHTKDEKRAKVLSKPVMMEFDRVIADAEALLVQHPLRIELH